MAPALWALYNLMKKSRLFTEGITELWRDGLISGEMLGLPYGLCHGWGGHMHLFARQHLAACSGNVGSSGPAGAGFALAEQYLRSSAVVAAFLVWAPKVRE